MRLVLALLLLTAACTLDPTAPEDPVTDRVTDPGGVLTERPRIAEAVAGYEELVAALLAALGPRDWQVRANGTSAGCADFPGVGGESRTLDLRWSESTLDDWAAAVDAVVAVTSSRGFTTPEIVVDAPGDHELRTTDTFGALLVLGSARRTTLTLSTGCHLP